MNKLEELYEKQLVKEVLGEDLTKINNSIANLERAIKMKSVKSDQTKYDNNRYLDHINKE